MHFLLTVAVHQFSEGAYHMNKLEFSFTRIFIICYYMLNNPLYPKASGAPGLMTL